MDDHAGKAEDLFWAACGLGAEQRVQFLDEQCHSDPSLRAEVESLLAHHDASASFLAGPAITPEAFEAGAELARAVPGPTPVKQIGHYRILEILGEGGMGVVYRAVQENPERTVALKLIKPGVQSRELLRRFEYESRILGWLKHPGIAQIFEAGVADTPEGPRPYFAMELIEGRPLRDYADVHRLDARSRLKLIAGICDAVHHAHQKGVIHRDLKPGNILVDESGQPKVLDFGVARATDADLRTTTLQTGVGQLVGTLGYMSPEQIKGDPEELDTRADVYALGVIGYELLTGRLPHDVSHKSVPEAARIISDEEPQRLSTVNRGLRGDIETIVTKALEKDKNRRYASAADLAGDIRRFLADQPISARPASAVYHFRKFARRNKALVAGVGIAFAALTAGLVQTTMERNRARAAETIARNEAAKAQAINKFLLDMFAAANPSVSGGADVRVRDLLDDAANRVAEAFAEQSKVAIDVRLFIGEAFRNLGLNDKAQPQLEEALRLARLHLDHGQHDFLNLLHSVALNSADRSQWAEAESLYRESLEGFRKLNGDEHPTTLGVMTNMVRPLAMTGKLEEAENLQRQTIEAYRRLYGPEHQRTLTSLHNLSSVLELAGKTAEREPILREVLQLQRKTLADDHPYTIFTMNSLAMTLFDLDRFGEAESLLREALERRTRVLGATNRYTLETQEALAATLAEAGDLAGAANLQRQALDGYVETMGEEHARTIACMSKLATFLTNPNQVHESENVWVKADDKPSRDPERDQGGSVKGAVLAVETAPLPDGRGSDRKSVV